MGEPTPIAQAQDAAVSWTDTLTGAAALLGCLPAIFGGLGTFIPQALHPAGTWAVETTADQIMTRLYTWSVVLAFLSPPATLVGGAFGIWTIRRVGRKSTYGRVLGVIIGAAVALSLALAVQAVVLVGKFRHH